MYYTKEEVKSILNNYERLYNRISDIISLHSALDECYYEINDIQFWDDCLTVNVEFYKWQDINHDCITIDLELLSNSAAFEAFKNEVTDKIKEKINSAEQKKLQQKQKAIDDAVKLLKDNGITKI